MMPRLARSSFAWIVWRHGPTLALNGRCVRPAGGQAEVQGRQGERAEEVHRNRQPLPISTQSRCGQLEAATSAVPDASPCNRHIRQPPFAFRRGASVRRPTRVAVVRTALWGIIDRGNTSGCRLAGTSPRTGPCAPRLGVAVRGLAQCAKTSILASAGPSGPADQLARSTVQPAAVAVSVVLHARAPSIGLLQPHRCINEVMARQRSLLVLPSTEDVPRNPAGENGGGGPLSFAASLLTRSAFGC
jgi:hypothetical protein